MLRLIATGMLPQGISYSTRRRLLKKQLRADFFCTAQPEGRMCPAQRDELFHVSNIVRIRGTALPVQPIDLDR
ncbi:hypothetical protein D3C81_2216600 [compost metagenome]